MPPDPPESLLAQLRSATTDLHHQLDRSLGFAEGQFTRKKYVAFLLGSLTALESLEPQLQPFFPAESVSRSKLLRADLGSLAAPTAVPQLAEVPAVSTSAAAFGARYVIEGSALGGVLLARSFDTALQLGGESLRYLSLGGARTGERWREFCLELERFGRMATVSMQSEACMSARAVFNLYAAAFRSTGAITVIS